MRVALLCPLAAQVQAPAVDSIIEWVLDAHRFVDTTENPRAVTRLIASRGQTAMARTQLGKLASEAEAEWFLWLDDDMIPPKDVLQKLLACKKNIVSAAYFSRTAADPLGRGQYPLCGFQFVSDDNVPFSPPELEPRGLKEVQIVGFGCLLMHRSVWDDVWRLSKGVPFRTEQGLTEDCHFLQYARHAGHTVWMDTSIVAGHLKTICITDRNRAQIGGEPQR